MNKAKLAQSMKAQAVGNPALVAIIPIVADVVVKLLGACKSEQDAAAAMNDPTPAQRARIKAEARRQIIAVGMKPSPANLDAAVELAIKQAQQATAAQRVEFLHNAYKAMV